MKDKFKTFIKEIKELSYPNDNKCRLAIDMIYAAFNGSLKATHGGKSYNALNDLCESNTEIKRIYNLLLNPYINKREAKELTTLCLRNFKTKNSINEEVYSLCYKLLDIKDTDTILQTNAPDESFVLNVYKSIKSDSFKPHALIVPDNSYAKGDIDLRLTLTGANYTILEDSTNAKKFNPSKIFLVPKYNLIDKNYIYPSESSSLYWDDVLDFCQKLKDENKIVSLVPNTLLSNNLDKEIKEKLLDEGLVEGVISLPLRYFSEKLNTEVSVVVFSRNNKNIKVCDINSIFTKSEIKEVNPVEITEYILERYFISPKMVSIEDVKNKDSNLVPSNIVTDEIYEGLRNLKELSSISTIKKRTKKTFSDFKKYIDQTSTSKVCLLEGTDIEDGQIKYDKLKRVIHDYSLSKYFVEKGDVLITNKSSTSKITLVDTSEFKLIPLGSMIVIKPNEGILDGTYLKMYLESEKGKELLAKAKRGKGTSTLHPADIGKLKIPLIDYDKQISLAKKYLEYINEIETKKKEIEKIKKELSDLINKGVTENGNE